MRRRCWTALPAFPDPGGHPAPCRGYSQIPEGRRRGWRFPIQGRKNFLREERRQLENLNLSIRVTTAVKTSSDIPGAIIAAADEHGASLIVVGARGKSVVEGILLGSVSKALLRRSRTSVLIMRHKIIEEMKRKTYEMFCPMIFNKVLCPVDFSPFSDRAIIRLSTTPGIRRVILLHVVSQGETETEIDDAIRSARDRIEETSRMLAVQGIEARAFVRVGVPSVEIVKIADEEDVSVIWMSSPRQRLVLRTPGRQHRLLGGNEREPAGHHPPRAGRDRCTTAVLPCVIYVLKKMGSG